MLTDKIWTRNFIVVCLSSFFMFLNFYMLAATFPLYVKESLNGNAQQMGLAITVYVVGGVIIRFFAGNWVDRYGRKNMALIGMVVFLLATVSYFGAAGIFLFLILRFIHGMGYAVASTATSTIASTLVPVQRQGEGMGYFSMFMSIAMVIGPAFGLFLWKDKNADVLLLAVCVVSALAFLFTLCIRVPVQQDVSLAEKPKLNRTFAAEDQRTGWRKFIEPTAVPISMAGFILAFSYSSITAFIAPFMNEIEQSDVTGYFFIVFAMMIVLFRPMIGKIFDKFSEHYLFYPGIALFASGLIMLSQANSALMILAAGTVLGIGYGALFPCFQTLSMMLSPESRRGSAVGTYLLLFDVGYGLGSYCMGIVASYANYRAVYLIAGLVPLLCVAVYYRFHHLPRAKLAIAGREARPMA